jgi:iron complex outermembrane receptor protein
MSMRKTQTGRKSLLAGASVLAAATAMFTAGGVSVAAAQDAEEGDAIVVTGTRIARRDAVAESPILTVSQEEMTSSGYVTVEQYLNTLPQVTPGISSQSNNPSSNGRAFVDLRGLGAGRNLVLLDGRRMIGQAAGGSIVDTNTIPAALVERVEIITGGAASTYGADAVSGVVNFILRDNFEGFAWDSQYRITEIGDGEEWSTDFTLGGNFADGRGNAVFNASYFNRDTIFKDGRDFAAQASSTTGTFPGGAYAPGAAANSPTQAAVDGVFGAGLCPNTGASFGFNPDGSLFCVGIGGGNPFDVVNYTGPQSHIATAFFPDFFSYNFEPDNKLVLPLERWNLFSRVQLDLNQQFRPYVQAMFTNYNASSELAATPAGGFTVPVTNPFIGPELAALLASRPVNPAAPFAFSKRFSQVGGRASSNTHDVWQIVLGTEGDLTDTWSYDVYASYGRSALTEIQNGNIRVPQFQSVLDNPATAGGGVCSTWNPFGINSALPADCQAFVTLEAKNTTLVEQRIVEGSVTGDLFEVPAGSVQIALGANYREIEFDFRPDSGLQPGLVAGFNGQLPISGTLDWFDLFGEIFIPILADLPGVDSLSITAGYRTSDNNLSGVAESWKVTGDWTVTDWLRFRAGVQTANRAPNIAELFAPQVPNFPNVGTANDPCNTAGAISNDPLMGRNGPNGAAVAAICAAQSPVAGGGAFIQTFGQAQALAGGNPNLTPETADSWSAGVVMNSPFNTGGFMDSLYLSVDYWSIEMEEVIAAVGALTIIQRCYNRDGANPGYNPANQWCSLFQRDAADGRVVDLLQLSQNQAITNTSGVDIVVGFGFDLGSMGSLDFNTVATWVELYETQTTSVDPTYDFVGTIGSGTGSATPEWRTTINATWSMDALTIGTTARWIDEMAHSNSVTGAGAGTGVPDKWYFDLRGSFDLTSNLTIRAGVNNVADTQPPLYAPNVQANTDPSTYDVLGRRFFVGFNLRM